MDGESQGSHSSGTGGAWVFADLAELDAAIGKWKAERDTIAKSDDTIRKAVALAVTPAQDPMSTGQAIAFHKALSTLLEYNTGLLKYTDAYIQKLTDARKNYAVHEDTSTALFTTLRSGA